MKQEEKERLQAERARTEAELKRLRSYLETEVDHVIDGGEDSIDAAADIYEREKTLAIMQTLQNKLTAIGRALRAAEKGAYGICEVCGHPIDPERLEVMPHSTTCVGCQKKLERMPRPRQPATFQLEED
jgi:RNA polymerase-binding transcription factor DksA